MLGKSPSMTRGMNPLKSPFTQLDTAGVLFTQKKRIELLKYLSVQAIENLVCGNINENNYIHLSNNDATQF